MDKSRDSVQAARDRNPGRHTSNNGGQLIQSNLQMNSETLQFSEMNNNDKFMGNQQMMSDYQEYHAFMR